MTFWLIAIHHHTKFGYKVKWFKWYILDKACTNRGCILCYRRGGRWVAGVGWGWGVGGYTEKAATKEVKGKVWYLHPPSPGPSCW